MTHPLNILLVATVALSAVFTGSWVPLAFGGAAELVWFAFLRRSPAWGRQTGGPVSPANVLQLRDQQARLARMSEDLRRRFLALDMKKTEIRRIVLGREGLAKELVASELEKVDGLADRFVDLAVRATELGRIVEDQDVGALEAAVSTADEAGRRGDAEAQLEAAAAVAREHQRARSGLERIERGIASIRNNVATLGSPGEFGGDVDEVLRAVEVATSAVRETEAAERRGLCGSGTIRRD